MAKFFKTAQFEWAFSPEITKLMQNKIRAKVLKRFAEKGPETFDTLWTKALLNIKESLAPFAEKAEPLLTKDRIIEFWRNL